MIDDGLLEDNTTYDDYILLAIELNLSIKNLKNVEIQEALQSSLINC